MTARLSAHAMTLMVDIALDHLAADSWLVADNPDLFHRAGADGEIPLDPRRPMERADIAMTRCDGAEAERRLADIFGSLLTSWADAGVSGIRALAPHRVPASLWRTVLGAVREVRPDFTALAWTPGLSPADVAALARCGFTHSAGSAPWWDGRAPWLAREYEERRLLLPSIGLVEDPAGPRIAAGVPSEDQPARRRAIERALALAATTGAGLLMPMGFEQGAVRPLDMTADRPADWSWMGEAVDEQVSAAISAAIRLVRSCAPLGTPGQMVPLSGPGAPVAAFARALGGDLRRAEEVAVVLANATLNAPASISPDGILAALDGRFPALRQVFPLDGGDLLTPGRPVVLAEGEIRVFAGRAAAPRTAPGRALAGKTARSMPRIAIERVTPAVDDGRFSVKRLAGEAVPFSADIFGDGHEVLAAVLRWQASGEAAWHEAPMTKGENDRWTGIVPLAAAGRHEVTIEAWRDLFATWRDEVEKKHAADVPIALELQEGIRLVEHAAARSEGDDAERFSALLRRLADGSEGDRLHDLLADETRVLMRRWSERTQSVRTEKVYPVMADRRAAAFASWYEMFPRSASDDTARHGTFDDVVRHLPRVRAMGFDVLYFTPIHPIGRRNRKGRNNTLKAGPGDPGSPYAIGAAEGGHDALHPELGDLDAFRRLVAAAEAHGLELALDFAIQCSPDHPWLAEHPGWFAWRPDGSLRYAENPPKKYEDIVNVDFYAPDSVPDLWVALRDVILHWIEQGVRTFRVDNPHTKPLPFWEWMIADVQARHPEAIFLSEAFTRPKMMKRLAKLGFTQSYTYFTWRNTKAELAEYLTELTTTEAADFYRPHFFVNTPDINPVFLQKSGRPGHLIRAVLATTLSGLWGAYCGFELCEARALPGKEEYLDSEKYEIRAWDWDRPGNIVAEITALNRIRRENPALQTHLGLGFLNCWNDSILAYRKMTPDRGNLVVVAVNLDPFAVQEASFEVPLWEFGLPDDAEVEVEDLLTGRSWRWRGKMQRLRLDPAVLPYAILRLAAPGTHA
ncbi:maltotransferase domain-containing protein [Roseomonas sp. HF4]|uniref:maltotransferase domain-containing protein n=1 Tax=Roseomonas sp. HF4 TaxID=2562313 RepID=UPI00197D5EAF|nr:maltotransferase domain-containing protein [Roseomonas sp. HF4]